MFNNILVVGMIAGRYTVHEINIRNNDHITYDILNLHFVRALKQRRNLSKK